MSGAVKRRNGEEEVIEDHVGKVRKREAGMGLYSSEVSPRPLSDNHVCVSPLTFRASCRLDKERNSVLISSVILFSLSM